MLLSQPEKVKSKNSFSTSASAAASVSVSVSHPHYGIEELKLRFHKCLFHQLVPYPTANKVRDGWVWTSWWRKYLTWRDSLNQSWGISSLETGGKGDRDETQIHLVVTWFVFKWGSLADLKTTKEADSKCNAHKRDSGQTPQRRPFSPEFC